MPPFLTARWGTWLVAGEGRCPRDGEGRGGLLAGAGDTQFCLLRVASLHGAVTWLWLWLSPTAKQGLGSTEELPSLLLHTGRDLH